MKIAVILCTYNRYQSLALALESVARSMMPSDRFWEVVIVNNNSTDATQSVAESFQNRYPGLFRYIVESTPGKSHALNRAIRETDSDVLAFMDDDVQVESDWLYMLTRIFEDEKCAGSGGRIVPPCDFKLPRWLQSSGRYDLAPLAMFDLGVEPGELKEPPFGTNMAFRREVFSRYGNFRCDLGPQPGSEIRSEDTEFGMRLLRGGERLWYEPAAVVHHAVSDHRLRKSYFLKWWYGKGRADMRELGSECDQHLSMFGVPLVLFRRLVIWSARWLLGFDPSQRFACRTNVWWLAGKIRESFGQFLRGHRLRIPQSEITQ